MLQLASRRVLTSAQRSTDQFFADAEDRELPTYAFIEPQIIGHAHNDMHPAFSMQAPGLNFDPPSSLIAGEDLLARVYDAIRAASSPAGSNGRTPGVATSDMTRLLYDEAVVAWRDRQIARTQGPPSGG